jgi:hydroxypyruvate reductase
MLGAYRRGLAAVRADRLVADALTMRAAELDLPIGPARAGSVTVCALGKAAVAMARGVASVLGPALAGGIAVTKDEPTAWAPSGVQVVRGGHPVPDLRSRLAAEAVLARVASVPTGDTIVVCVSGGASSLCAAPVPPMTQEELERRVRNLVAAGAPIAAINEERRRFLQLADGRLARAAVGRCIVTLVLADVMPSPTANPTRTPNSAGPDLFGVELARVVGSGPTLGPDGPVGPVVVVGGPATFAQALRAACGSRGNLARALTLDLSVASEVAAQRIVDAAHDASDGAWLCGVGEPTVTLPQGASGPAAGSGGRAQHVALLIAERLDGDTSGAAVLVAASDGSDGTTEAAGAVVDGSTVRRARRAGVDAEAARLAFASRSFHRAAGALIATGPTGTNLLDGVVVVPGFLRRQWCHP